MSKFFEILSEMPDKKVVFLNDTGEHLLALDIAGLEELANSYSGLEPIFCGEDKLLWEDIASVDFEEMRLGRHHIPQIAFEDLDALFKNMSDEKITRVKDNCGHFVEPRTKYHLPHNEISHIQIGDFDIQKPLKGFSGRERTRVLMQVYEQFTDKPVQIVEDRVSLLHSKRELTEAEQFYLAEHQRKMQYLQDRRIAEDSKKGFLSKLRNILK